MIAFEPLEAFLDSFPGAEALDEAELRDCLEQTKALIVGLDGAEPKNQNSEAFEQWAQRHEDLEDILDELLDALEEKN